MQKKYIVFIVIILLFLIPFFWLKPGEMDLGGDSIRLYFYDPIAFLKSSGIYHIVELGKSLIEPNYFFIPFVSLIAFLRIFFSTTTVISIFNGLKLSVGFISTYLIIQELLKGKANDKQKVMSASILSGLFYIFAFSSINMWQFWERAITSHNQVFLNPLIFYLLLKYLLSKKQIFLFILLFVSFVFAPNFALTSAPPFFSFYPIAIVFIILYLYLFNKKQIPWKEISIGFLLFLGVQAFQLLPQAVSLFDKGSYTNLRVFANSEAEGINYFTAIRVQGKAVLNILLPSEIKNLQWLSIFTPFVIFIGYLINKRNKKQYLFISIFFLITLFLCTANITNLGYIFYRNLFHLPGFSMFRNFFTQWLYIYIFFYALLFSLAIYNIFIKLKHFYYKIFLFILFLFIIAQGIPLITGAQINQAIIRGSANIRPVFKMDSKFLATLDYVKTLPDDGKILVLPFTDFYRQLVSGSDGGVYEGPSIITYLTQKYTFVGYHDFGYQPWDPAPYAQQILEYSKSENYQALTKIFNTLNIRYIFYNSDPRIYDAQYILYGDYSNTRPYMPKNQFDYQSYIKNLPFNEIYSNSSFKIYEIDKNLFDSTIFLPVNIYFSDKLNINSNADHSIFINKTVCNNPNNSILCNSEYHRANIDINFKMINPIFYSVHIKANETYKDITLVLQQTFHTGWKLYFNNKVIADSTHIPVNGYANGWLISDSDVNYSKDFTLFLKLDNQKYFYYGSVISMITFGAITILIIKSFKK